MNETDAKCIVCSAWEALRYLGEEYEVEVTITTKDETSVHRETSVAYYKDYKMVFLHRWQFGDTIDSFLEGFNARINSLFNLEA